MSGRVLVADRGFGLDAVRRLLAGLDVEVVEDLGPWSGADVVALLVGTEVRVEAEELERLPSLRVVATCSVGFDHVALAEARRRGIWVCNVPDYCSEEVADHSIALVLALLRGLVELDRAVRAGGWNHAAAGTLHRFAGTRLGVVGFGRTGRGVAARGLALGFEVWAADPAIPAEAIAAAGVRPAALDELLGACDAVSLHLPLMAQTRNLFDAKRIARMKVDAVLICTARGGLIDEQALAKALREGRLMAAGLDVYAEEPPAATHALLALENVVLSPHSAALTEECAERMAVISAQNCLDGLDGRIDPSLIANPEVLGGHKC
jgi:D-3-phosphoglycerate dehydrogenase